MKADLTKLRIAAVLGLLAVGLGAMGAHGLEKHWSATLEAVVAAKRLEIWKTAVLYQMFHAIVMLVLAFGFPEPRQARWAFRSFLLGVILFSGSLYGLCLTKISWLGPVTPIGGVLLMVGWLMLVFSGRKA